MHEKELHIPESREFQEGETPFTDISSERFRPSSTFQFNLDSHTYTEVELIWAFHWVGLLASLFTNLAKYYLGKQTPWFEYWQMLC